MTPDVIVIGGGLHGCSAALHLALRRQRVIVLERAAVGRHASGVNAGGVRTLGRDIEEVPLAIAGMELWRSIESLVGDDCGFLPHGQIKVAETQTELQELEERREALLARGHDHEVMIDAAELHHRAPGIAPHCIAALMVADDGAADPYRTTMAFRRKAESLGVIFREGEGVVAIERMGQGWRVKTPGLELEAPVIVNAAGAWADAIAAMVGDHAPITTRCSMMIVTERLPHFLEPVIGATGRKLSFKQAANGSLLIGGGHQAKPDKQRETYQLDMLNLAQGALAAAALFPLVQDVGIVRGWAGLEAQTPDHLPIIGASPSAPGIFHSFGYSGHGFQLGPIVGSALAELIVTGATNLPIAPFALERFQRLN
ncbi:MAG: NAD(P)/FAD-dependent oxidoreductase [Bosea sp. (in: a-proteobacteria)]